MWSSCRTSNHEKQTRQPQHRRAVTIAYLICIICFFCHGCASQYAEPPGLVGPPGAGGAAGEVFADPPPFQQMTFEPKHRGGYNISKCSSDLFNCWEIITPEEFCYHVTAKYVATTMCDRMRIYCSQDGFDVDDYKYIFEAREFECSLEQKSRRRIPSASDRMHVLPWSIPPPSAAELQALRLQLRGHHNLPPPMPSRRPEPDPKLERDATAQKSKVADFMLHRPPQFVSRIRRVTRP